MFVAKINILGMGILFVVATPIGNLEDITIRALNTLRDVDLIACEDTRRTKVLLNYYYIPVGTSTPSLPLAKRKGRSGGKRLISYHQHSKLQKIDTIIEKLKNGEDVALVTDAGTPGINDPGGFLINEAIKRCNNLTIVPIPGPSALTTLLSVSGIKSDRFLFLGFLPKKKGRQTMMRNLMKIGNMDLYDAVIIYESPYRILRTLEDLQLVVGNKEVVIGRELTKKFEEIYRGSISQAIIYFKENEPRGEFVVVIKTTK